MNVQRIETGKIPFMVHGEPDPGAVEQMETCLADDGAVAGALMADHHLGYSMPIGGVIAYDGKVSPSGVGYDIACGNKAVRLDADADDVRDNIATIMDDIWSAIQFGVGQSNPEAPDHDLFDDDAWRIPVAHKLKQKAQTQLGTVGSGNHYVDVFVDERDRVWVGVHFGSRGFGHGIASHFMKAGGGKDGIHAPAVLLDVGTSLGDDYIACMRLAGRYAYAGRDWVCERAAQIIGAPIVEQVHNHHNFAWEEEIDGQPVWVVRKGATPAYPGQRGFVGGTMGDNSVILCGAQPLVEGGQTVVHVYEMDDGTASGVIPTWGIMRDTLFSTVHGAGRAMGRTRAAGKWKYDKEQGMRVQVREGLINPEMMRSATQGVELRGGGLDEAPQAYKSLWDVLRAHAGTIYVQHELTPIGVAMAGPGV